MGELDEGGWVRGEDGGGEQQAQLQNEQRPPVSAVSCEAPHFSRARSIHFQVERVLLLFDALAADTPARPPTKGREFSVRGRVAARRAGGLHGA